MSHSFKHIMTTDESWIKTVKTLQNHGHKKSELSTPGTIKQ